MRTAVGLCLAAVCLDGAAQASGEEFLSLFNGENLDGWTVSDENPGSFIVEDGMIRTRGPRAHLFYTGPVNGADFRNFEFRADVRTLPGSNSGIYFHTEYQAEDWPAKGFEAQINNAGVDPRRTGGLYNVADIYVPRETDPKFAVRYMGTEIQVSRDASPVRDGEWFEYAIMVRDRTIEVRIDGETLVIWTEPEGWPRPGRRIDSGTFALQAHDPNSEVHFRDLRVRVLD